MWEALTAIGTVGLVIWAVVEHIGRRRAEKEIEMVKRRGDAPFFQPSSFVFSQLFHLCDGKEVRFWGADNGNVLCFCRDETARDMPSETPVIFVVTNAGQTVRSLSVKLDGQPIALKREAEINDANGLQFLEYPYAPEKHGKEQRLAFSFETVSGVQDTHTYLTRHGFRVLTRVDP